MSKVKSLIINYCLIVFGCLLLNSCIDIAPTGGEDFDTGYTYYYQYMLDFSGNRKEQMNVIGIHYSDESLINKQRFLSDYSLMISQVSYGYQYEKTIYFNDRYYENWNELWSKSAKLSRYFDSKSPYDFGVLFQESKIKESNKYREDSIQFSFNRGKVELFEKENSYSPKNIYTFQSSFTNSTTYFDTTLTDIKIKSNDEYYVLLNADEYRISSDSLSTETKYVFVKREVLFGILNDSGELDVKIRQLVNNQPIYFSSSLAITSDWLIIKASSDHYLLLNKQLEPIAGDLFKSTDGNPVLMPIGKQFVLYTYDFNTGEKEFFVRNEDGSKEKLSSIVSLPDSLIDYAAIYKDRYISLLTDDSQTVRLFDKTLKKWLFTLDTGASQFVANGGESNLKGHHFIPFLLMNDNRVQVIIW